MKIFKALTASLIISGFASSALAQDSGFYGNVGVKTYEFDTYNILGRVGYDFNQYFGAEVEGSFGIIDEEQDGISAETTWDIGGYVVGLYPLAKNFDMFARVGYSNVRIEAEGFGDSLSANFDGVAVGAGLQYFWDDNNGARIGYTYNEADGLDADVIDLSFVRKF